MHTFEEIRICSPVDPNVAAPEAAIPQAAWEALLRNMVQGLCPPYTPRIRRLAPDHPPPGMGHPRPTGPPHTPPPPHQQWKRHRQGEGKGREGTPRQGGKEAPKVAGRRPQGQGSGGDTTRERETSNGPGRGRIRDRGTEGQDAAAGTRAHTQEGHATTERAAPSHPQRTPRDPWRLTPANICRRSSDLTPYGLHWLMPSGHRNPHRQRRAHPHGEKGLHPPTEPLRTPPRSSQPRPLRQATTPATARASTQAPEEGEDTAAPPRLEARTPRDTGAKHRPPGRATPRTPTSPTSPSGTPEPSRDPASHPTPNRTPQSAASHNTSIPVPHHDTGKSNHHRPQPTPPPRHNTRQHGTPHRSAPPCNAQRQGTPRHQTPQHDAARRGTAQDNTARQGATRHDKAGRTTTQHRPARGSTAKHGTSHHGAAKHTRTPKRGTQTEGLTRASRRTPRNVPHHPAAHRQGATAGPASTAAAHPHKRPPES